MRRQLSVLILLTVGGLSAGCGGAAPTANTNTNANTVIILDPANMPPGLSASPLPITGDIPGIPANRSPLPKGTTPTPGIPSPEELKKGPKKGTTPTPGIPDPETLRKSMKRTTTSNQSTIGDTPMMKSTNRPKP